MPVLAWDAVETEASDRAGGHKRSLKETSDEYSATSHERDIEGTNRRTRSDSNLGEIFEKTDHGDERIRNSYGRIRRERRGRRHGHEGAERMGVSLSVAGRAAVWEGGDDGGGEQGSEAMRGVEYAPQRCDSTVDCDDGDACSLDACVKVRRALLP